MIKLSPYLVFEVEGWCEPWMCATHTYHTITLWATGAQTASHTVCNKLLHMQSTIQIPINAMVTRLLYCRIPVGTCITSAVKHHHTAVWRDTVQCPFPWRLHYCQNRKHTFPTVGVAFPQRWLWVWCDCVLVCCSVGRNLPIAFLTFSRRMRKSPWVWNCWERLN